jgi:polyisoprenoid-binding protein YceI
MSKTVIRVVVVVAVLAVGAPAVAFAYFHFVQKPAPRHLSLADPAPGSPAGGGAGSVAGVWKPTSGTEVGYRVSEVAFGQKAEAVGRTSQVSGTMTIDGTTVTAVELSVDMASVQSDQSRRDNQFRGRIMDVADFPSASFRLTSPIPLGGGGSGGSGTFSVTATGDLTLRGTTRRVTVTLKAQRRGDTIAVNGTIPIKFAEWKIPNPSFGPISTEDHGELELLVVFARA